MIDGIIDLDRQWRFIDQDGEHIITEEGILRMYFPWWSKKLRELGRQHLISPRSCIEDWATCHWATQLPVTK